VIKKDYYEYGTWVVILIVAALLGGHIMGVIQEPPHIIHTATLEPFSAPYYGWVEPSYFDPKGAPAYWEKSSHIEKDIAFSPDINWSNVYKVNTRVAGHMSSSRGTGKLIFWYNPSCSRITDPSFENYLYKSYCGWNNYVITGKFRDNDHPEDPYSVNSVTTAWTSGIPITRMAFGAYNADRYDSVRIKEATISVFEEVECTEDKHCVSAAPKCNLATNMCEPIITEPSKPEPTGIMAFLSDLVAWLKQIFSGIFSFTITGPQVVQPGTTHDYQIDLTAATPDHDYTDGTYQTQYAYWALISKDGTILQGQTAGVEVNGVYNTIATVDVPAKIDDYIIVATITQIDSNYEPSTSAWVHGEETIITREAIDLKTEAPFIDKPMASGVAVLLEMIWEWLTGLFDWLW